MADEELTKEQKLQAELDAALSIINEKDAHIDRLKTALTNSQEHQFFTDVHSPDELAAFKYRAEHKGQLIRTEDMGSGCTRVWTTKPIDHSIEVPADVLPSRVRT